MFYAFRDLGLGGVGVGETAPHSLATLAGCRPGPREGWNGLPTREGPGLVDRLPWGGGRGAGGSLHPTPTRRLLDSQVGLPLWTTPTQGFPGSVPPTRRAGLGGVCASPPLPSLLHRYEL